MPGTTQALSRVERALKRLNLLNKPCYHIAQATGMEVLHTTDTGFNSWLSKLEKLPIKHTRYNKRKLQTKRNAKAAQAHIYEAKPNLIKPIPP